MGCVGRSRSLPFKFGDVISFVPARSVGGPLRQQRADEPAVRSWLLAETGLRTKYASQWSPGSNLLSVDESRGSGVFK